MRKNRLTLPFHLKICGITNPFEIKFLDDLGVSFAGLWFGIPKGAYNLNKSKIVRLSKVPRSSMKLILVTLKHSLHEIKTLIEKADISGIQLHGFQLPSTVKKIRIALGKKIKVIKVIHVDKRTCLEEKLIEQYIRSGVDYFIIDNFKDKHHIGSNGVPLCNQFLKSFIPTRLPPEKIILAGGIDERNIGSIYRNYRPFGVDIDSGARFDGKICTQRVTKIISSMGNSKP